MGLSSGLDGEVRYSRARSVHFISTSCARDELFKSKFEINLMRKAADISASAHINAMKIAKPGIKEYELEAELISTFVAQGQGLQLTHQL